MLFRSDKATFHRWLNRGERDRTGPFRAFCDAIKDAEARAVVGWLAHIQKAAADGEWTAAAWKLERRYPETYGRRIQETTTTGTMRVEVVYVDEAIGPPMAIRALPLPEGAGPAGGAGAPRGTPASLGATVEASA